MGSFLSKKISTTSAIHQSSRSQFPKNIKPMLATLVDELPNRGKWVYEIKWDGYRALAYCKKNQIDLFSRNQKSFNRKFYPLIEALRALKLNAVLDGEITVIKESGKPHFESLQNWRSEADGELIYYAFDLLWLNGESVMHLPLLERKGLLKKIIPSKGLIRISQSFAPKKEFLTAVKEIGLEGIVAKRVDSLYCPGIRSYEWLKIKAKKRHEVVIGGYTRNENSPKLFSSLLVGLFENGKFRYIGKVGTGFNRAMQEEMMGLFHSLTISKCPFTVEPDVNIASRFRPHPPHATVKWLFPKLVCEVSYIEMTGDGVMRHPSFEGIRQDKNAQEVHPEVAQPAKLISNHTTRIRLNPIKKGERKTLLNPSEEIQTKNIKGHILKFNNLSKIFWPQDNVTKRDLLNYYYQVAPYILPYLKNRPQSLNRFPNGIKGESFYQKDVTKSAPEWIKKFPYRTSQGIDKNFLVVQDEADILWMANLGAIEMNPWNSTIDKPDYPDWCIIDIDPTEKNNFNQVIETAQITKKVLDGLELPGYCKTSGSSGMHIYIPLGAKYSYEECQLLGRKIATQVHLILPNLTSIKRHTHERKGQIYVDFLQNRPKATLAAPYSVRPKPGAPISTPLAWEEVKPGLLPTKFTFKKVLERLKSEGDLFRPVLGKGINLKKALKRLENL